MLNFLRLTPTSFLVAFALITGTSSWGQNDDFNDGNFTLSPTWLGDTVNFMIIQSTPLVGGNAATDSSYLGSLNNVGAYALTTPSAEIAEWKFSLGSSNFAPTNLNHFGVILMSDTAVTGSILTTSWSGYYLKVGSAASTDYLELWKKTDATAGTKVGEWTTPSFGTTALTNGLNIRITKNDGAFTLYYSTGFTYATTPTISGGTVTDAGTNTPIINTSFYFGIYRIFGDAGRRVFIDNIVLGNSLPSPYGTLANTLNEATLDMAEFTVTLTNDSYVAGPLTPARFTLNNAPAGVTVAAVTRTSATIATVRLAYDDTDFDNIIFDFSVNVAADQLTSAAPLTTGNLTLIGINETITSTPPSPSGLTYTEGAGPSTASSFTISSSTLMPGGGTITISESANYEVSTTSATSGFGATATLTYTGTGTFAANTVWVRLKADRVQGTYNNEQLTITGGKATRTINISGNVTMTAPENNLCGDAELLTVDAAAVTGTMIGATYTAISGVTAKYDVWYKFQAVCTGTQVITVGNFLGDIDVTLHAACPTGNATLASGTTLNTMETISTNLAAGTIYYVRVFASNTAAATSTFTIQVRSAFAPIVSMGIALGITHNATAPIAGTASITGCGSGPVTSYGIQYSTSSTFSENNINADGSNLNAVSFSVALSGLTPATTYYYRAYAQNLTGISYSAQRTFTTLTQPVTVPYTQGFEGTTPELSYTNTTVNSWVVGTAANNGGTKGLYISNNSTTLPYAYSTGTTTDNYASVRIDLTSVTAATLFFDWKSGGEIGSSVSDYGEVYINTGGTDVLISNSKEFAGTTEYQTKSIDLTPYVGGIRTLRFRWYNDFSNGTGFPLAIDNIEIKSGKTAALNTAAVTAPGYNKATLGGEVTVANGTVTERGVVYSIAANPTTASSKVMIGSGVGAFSQEVTGLTDNALYYVRAYAINGTGTSYGNQVTFTTAKIAAPVATTATPLVTEAIGFKANWDAVPNAGGYKLDVSTIPTFGTESPASVAEGFETGMPASSYNTASYTLGSGTWAFTSIARANIRRTGNYSCQFQLNTGAITSPALYKVSSVSFYARRNATTTSTLRVDKIVNGVITQIGSLISLTDSFVLYTIPVNETNSGVQIKITNTANNVVYLDDLTLSYQNLVVDFVANYNNKTVTGTSDTVTGLALGTTYYYRVRAVANSTSDNSNTITAVADTPNVWIDGAWTLVTPPTNQEPAIIKDDYDTGLNGDLSVLNLQVESGDVVVAEESVLNVVNGIAVTGGTVTVESNGMIMQSGNTNQNTGNVKVHRNSAELYRGDYTMWSAPVAGQNVFDFSNGTVLSRFYTYNTTTNHLESMFATQQDTEGVNFAAGQGYLIRMPNGSDVEGYIAGTAPMTFDGEFTGVPNNGDIPVTLSADGLGFNAIGNPYPSMIDADEFLQRNAIDNQRIDGTLYFWRKKNGVEGDAYATYTYVGGAAGSGTPGSSDDPELEEPILTEVPNGRIQTGQGFLVKALMGGSQPLFANTLRMADFSQDDQFFRMANTTGVVKHRMWLNLKNPAGLVFQSLVGYMTGATNGLDTAIDGKRFDEAAAGFYSVADAAKLTIQGRALPFMASDVVPMGYKALTAGSHTITLSNMDGLFAEGQDIFLKDNVLGVTHNLKEAGYTFATEAGTFDERFEIVYAQALGTDTQVLDANSIVVYKQGSAINISSGTIEMTGVAVYDIQGRELYSKTGINSTEAVITNLQSAQQVLIVKITTAKNGKVSKKIVF